MKVFDIKIGNTMVLRDIDPFRIANHKLLPGDVFVDVVVKDGKVLIDGTPVPNAITNGRLQIKFVKGKADNPKVNAIMLVEGGEENTHKKSLQAFQSMMAQMADEKAEARKKAEQFFAEDAYDYEERIDGRGPFNRFLKHDYALEASVVVFLLIFF